MTNARIGVIGIYDNHLICIFVNIDKMLNIGENIGENYCHLRVWGRLDKIIFAL